MITGINTIFSRRMCCGLLAALLPITSLLGQLSAGDLMFVAYNSDGDDGFSIVALQDIPANSTIYFTDNEWNELAIGGGGAFVDQNEGEMTWSTGGLVITQGTVVSFREIDNASNTNYGASTGSLSGTMSLSNSDEVIYAFEGSDNSTPTVFLSAIANDGFSGVKGALTNTGLKQDTNAIAITGDEDVAVYTGSTLCNGSVTDCAVAIATVSSWSTQDGSGSQDQDASMPDFPDDVAVSFGGIALPIELLSFTAQNHGPYSILLQWETATEINNDYFEVYRSETGEHFERIALEEGAGTTADPQQYFYEDYTIKPHIFTYLYRLRQVDFDGQSSTSETQVVHRQQGENRRSVYPNPVEGNLLYIRGGEYSKAVFTDLLGNTVFEQHLVSNQRELDVSELNPGMYILTLSSAYERSDGFEAFRVLVR